MMAFKNDGKYWGTVKRANIKLLQRTRKARPFNQTSVSLPVHVQTNSINPQPGWGEGCLRTFSIFPEQPESSGAEHLRAPHTLLLSMLTFPRIFRFGSFQIRNLCQVQCRHLQKIFKWRQSHSVWYNHLILISHNSTTCCGDYFFISMTESQGREHDLSVWNAWVKWNMTEKLALFL